MSLTHTEPSLAIERTMKAPAERIYEAFLDPEIMAKYQTPPGTEFILEAFDARVGGTGRYAFKGEQGGMTFDVKFIELVEFTTIHHTYKIDMPPPMDADMEIKITLTEGPEGTKVLFEQWGLPAPIPVDGAKAGWTGMIDRLQALVEA